MNTKTNSRKWSWIQLNQRGFARTAILFLLLMLTLPAVVQAQFSYTINNGTITITGYTGSGGAVVIPSMISGLLVTSIGDDAFAGCTSLTSVMIPYSVTSIGEYAFGECTRLATITIGNNVTSIGDDAFEGCTSLTSVAIPNRVTSIGDGAFESCTSLTTVLIGNSVTNIGSAAFASCTSLNSLTVPNGLIHIGAYAFRDCYSLTSVAIPNSVTYIGEWAFAECSSLNSLTIPNGLSAIAERAFGGCGLASVTIPNSVTNVGDWAFGGCTSLTNVTIPNSVTSIGDFAFEECQSLASVTVPDSVISIGEAAFGQCNSLSAITVDPLNPAYSSVNGVLFDKSQTELVEYPGGRGGSYTVPDSVTSIGSSAFSGCIKLASVIIPDSVTSIGAFAFEFCGNLTSITIGNSVMSIGDFAFFGCTRLANVTIGNAVSSIGANTFYGCTSLTNITIPDSVTEIGFEAFLYCTSLTSATIGSGMTSIGDLAFDECSSLSAITVDPLNSVYSSVAGVLLDKSQTTLIQYPGGISGGYTIPNTVTNIRHQAFHWCAGMTSVTIPDSVTSIGEATFQGCTGLTNVTMGNGLVSIGDLAFNDCGALMRAYFKGNAPALGGANVFAWDTNTIVYYLPGTTGWGATYGGCPTAVWFQAPTIATPPQTQTAEAGSAVGLWVDASSPLPLFCLWRLNATNLTSWSTNCDLELTNVQFSQSGAYTVVISNVLGAATSSPAMLNVIAAVERRPVPGVKVTGQTGTLLNVDCADSLSSAPNWTTLGSVSLTSTSEYYFDLTLPLPPHRYYQAWQTGMPAVMPSLDLHLVPAITLTGDIGDSVRLDYINQFGPIDAWVTLATVPLTNTSQLYFDVFAWRQPQRLYRLVPLP